MTNHDEQLVVDETNRHRVVADHLPLPHVCFRLTSRNSGRSVSGIEDPVCRPHRLHFGKD